MKYLLVLVLIGLYLNLLTGCSLVSESDNDPVPLSPVYSVKVGNNASYEKIKLFHNQCNIYDPSLPDMLPKDKGPLTKYEGYSVDWCNFILNGETEIVVEVLDTAKVKIENVTYRVFPSRKNVSIQRIEDTNKFTFLLKEQGQYSVEIGTENGWKHALLIFANPPETDLPELDKGKWLMAENASSEMVNNTADFDAIYFKPGIHDIGVFRVPSNIKQIYLPENAWVYGAFVMDGHDKSDVKIYGRGVLSGARLKLRESHSIEALNNANNITVSGITIADYVYFAIRLLGDNNHIEWTKIVGGWIYNCDGIAAYSGSKICNCFIWANDDNIKLYDDNLTVDDVVCWNLNNGAIFQLSWSKFTSSKVTVRNVDVIRTDYSGRGLNHGIINCRTGNGGYHRDYIFENVTVETPTNIVINLAPDGSGHPIENFILRNWNVKMDMSKGLMNKLIGISEQSKIDMFNFSNFIINDTCITEENFNNYFETQNAENISFKCEDISLLHVNDIRIRDPYILIDSKSRTYYMYAQTQNRKDGLGAKSCGVEVYTSTDMEYWTKPKVVFEVPNDFWANKSVWAPEVHHFNGKYYLFATLTGHEVLGKHEKRMDRVPRGTSILWSDSPMGPFKPFFNGPHTPREQMCLDGTFWREDGRNYMVYCREWIEIEDGTMELIELTSNLSDTIGSPKTLFKATDGPWVRSLWESSQQWHGFITDGPFVYRTKIGKLLMIWSSFNGEGYVIGIAESTSGKIHGPWIQQSDPLFSSNGGHGMIFNDFEGRLLITLHQPNNNGLERAKIFEIVDSQESIFLKQN